MNQFFLGKIANIIKNYFTFTFTEQAPAKKNIKMLFLISMFVEILFQMLNAICIKFNKFSMSFWSSKYSERNYKKKLKKK